MFVRSPSFGLLTPTLLLHTKGARSPGQGNHSQVNLALQHVVLVTGGESEATSLAPPATIPTHHMPGYLTK